MLEKGGFDLRQSSSEFQAKTDDTGGDGGNGGKISNGGSGGDGDEGDDDDYFDEGDEEARALGSCSDSVRQRAPTVAPGGGAQPQQPIVCMVSLSPVSYG